MYLHKRHSHVYIRHAAHGLHVYMASGRMCASPNKHGIGNVRVQCARREEKEIRMGKKERGGKREMGEKRERERYRVDGGGLSYASGVRPLVRSFALQP